jgi:hypothetical protein
MIKNLSNNSQKNMVKIERMPEKTKLGKGKVKDMRKRKRKKKKQITKTNANRFNPLWVMLFFSLPKK